LDLFNLFYKNIFLLATASVCSDDTVEMDHLSPMTPITAASTTTTTITPRRLKPALERKEHILTPISNGPTPVRVSIIF
jgi:hypothetical protein